MRLIDKNEFEQMPLEVHKFLRGIPIHSLTRLDLPGGKRGMTVLDIKETVGFNTEKLEAGGITRTLFWLRGFIGYIFGWDDAEELADSISFLSKLTGEYRERSLVPPGQKEGISRVIYCFENEFLAEIINRTVHCFWVMATRQTDDGYVLFMAVYVKKLNWFTPLYMALVTPMLKWIIYPALNKSVISNWKNAERRSFSTAAHA